MHNLMADDDENYQQDALPEQHAQTSRCNLHTLASEYCALRVSVCLHATHTADTTYKKLSLRTQCCQCGVALCSWYNCETESCSKAKAASSQEGLFKGNVRKAAASKEAAEAPKIVHICVSEGAQCLCYGKVFRHVLSDDIISCGCLE